MMVISHAAANRCLHLLSSTQLRRFLLLLAAADREAA